MVRMSEQYIIHANCLDVLRDMNENCVDALETDPPYGLSFMNKKWDREIPGPEYWSEILRVLKPGAHGVVMSAPKNYHRLACVLEDVGFELRDQILWLYGNGFPKSHNVALGIDKHFGYKNRGQAIPTASSYQACDHNLDYKLTSNPVDRYEAQSEEAKQYEGYGTALKPAYEPIALIRKPLEGTVAQNVLKWGVGALHIDVCRIGNEDNKTKGRWPANICHDGSDEAIEKMNIQGGYTKSPKFIQRKFNSDNIYNLGIKTNFNFEKVLGMNDEGYVSRYFYCSKASRKERELGLHDLDPINVTDGRKKTTDNPYQRGKTKRLNTHPTVKPISLCRWLSRLICPPGKLIIDPFTGSGSFGCAAALEDFDWIGMEIEEESAILAEKRIKYWKEHNGK